MATPRKVMVILSSVRDGRHGAKVAQAVMNHLAPYADRIQPEILGKCLFSTLLYFGNWNFGIEHFRHMEFYQLEFWHMEFCQFHFWHTVFWQCILIGIAKT